MKTVNLKISLIALAIGMFMVSCGGGNSNKQSGTVSETKAKAPKGGTVVGSQTTKPADYTAGALAKMASLGKTEKNKRLVTVGDNSDWTVYTVRTFADGKCTDNSDYTFCRANIGKELFDAKKLAVTEANDADLWTHFSYGADDGDWQSWYGTAKKLDGMGIKIVEQ